MVNILTFDLEDWYHGNFLENEEQIKNRESRVVEPTLRILELLKQTNSKATFFVLGSVAEEYPALIKKIHEQGHEIASHGYKHRLVYKLSPQEFSKDVDKSLKVLHSIINEKIIGYRAPYWSINPDMEWPIETLIENGMLYDSSIYPFKTYLYGDNEAPRFKYKVQTKKSRQFIELPPSVLEVLGKRIPFCGGFYFRLLPYWLIRRGFQQINKKEKQPAVFYLHPYEIDNKKTKNSKGFKNNFILHVNVKKAEKKLTKLLNDFQFISIKNYLYEFSG